MRIDKNKINSKILSVLLIIAIALTMLPITAVPVRAAAVIPATP